MKQAGALHNETVFDDKHTNGTHTPKDEFHNLFEKGEEYLKTRTDLLKLKAVSKASDILSTAISKAVFIVCLLFFITLLNIGLALLIGDWLGNSYYGFFILAGVYLLIGIIMNASGDKMIKGPVANSLIQKFIK